MKQVGVQRKREVRPFDIIFQNIIQLYKQVENSFLIGSSLPTAPWPGLSYCKIIVKVESKKINKINLWNMLIYRTNFS